MKTTWNGLVCPEVWWVRRERNCPRGGWIALGPLNWERMRCRLVLRRRFVEGGLWKMLVWPGRWPVRSWPFGTAWRWCILMRPCEIQYMIGVGRMNGVEFTEYSHSECCWPCTSRMSRSIDIARQGASPDINDSQKLLGESGRSGAKLMRAVEGDGGFSWFWWAAPLDPVGRALELFFGEAFRL